MKNLILVFAAIITLAACNKQASKKPAPKETMTAEQLKAKLGIQLEGIDYGNERGRSNKPKANAVTLAVWFNDLTLSNSAGTLTTTISPNAEWGGVQKFFTIDTTNNGVSVCNWYFITAPATMTCNSNGPGSYRSWTSDRTTYDVHVSSFLVIE
jgi:hypothetical protein